LIGSEWGAESLSLPKGWERLGGVRGSSVHFEDIDNLSGLGGTDGPLFDLIIIAQFWVQFQKVLDHASVQTMEEDVDRFLVAEHVASNTCK